MLRKSDFFKTFWVIPVTMLLCSVEIITVLSGGQISASTDFNSFENKFYGMVFNGTYRIRENSDVICSVFGLIQPYLFNFLFGTYIYNDLQCKSIYYFVRQPNRTKWYTKKCLYLLMLTFEYCFLQLIIPFLIAMQNSGEAVDKSAVFILITSYISLIIFTYFTTLLINIISIKLGSVYSFICVYVLTVIGFFISIIYKEIYLFGGKIFINRLNFVDNVMLIWHGSAMDKTASIIVNFVYLTGVFFAGMLLVNKIDIGLIDKEINT